MNDHRFDCQCDECFAGRLPRVYRSDPNVFEELLPFMPAPMIEPGLTYDLSIVVQRLTKPVALRVSYATRAAFSSKNLHFRHSEPGRFIPLDLRTPVLLTTNPDATEPLCVWEGELDCPALSPGETMSLTVINASTIPLSPAIVVRAKQVL